MSCVAEKFTFIEHIARMREKNQSRNRTAIHTSAHGAIAIRRRSNERPYYNWKAVEIESYAKHSNHFHNPTFSLPHIHQTNVTQSMSAFLNMKTYVETSTRS